MTDEVENHTNRLFQQMRAEMQDFRSAITGRFDDMNERFDDLTNRVDGNTLILNMLAGFVSTHEDRLDRLEQDRA